MEVTEQQQICCFWDFVLPGLTARPSQQTDRQASFITIGKKVGILCRGQV